MAALRHSKTNALAIVPEDKVEMFLKAGYQIMGREEKPAPNLNKPKRTRKPKRVTENATDAD